VKTDKLSIPAPSAALLQTVAEHTTAGDDLDRRLSGRDAGKHVSAGFASRSDWAGQTTAAASSPLIGKDHSAHRPELNVISRVGHVDFAP